MGSSRSTQKTREGIETPGISVMFNLDHESQHPENPRRD